MVGLHAVLEGFLCIVLSVNQRLAGNVINAICLWRIEFQMVRASTWLVNATPLNPFQKDLLVDLKLKDSVDSHILVLEQTVEHPGLL